MAEYCLRWNNHQPNLVTVFSELLSAESLVDVTLATDGHFIHAHKLVLSACSAYFKDLFGSNPCKHPIVFLKDIRIEDLKTVIDFIYRGEVNVAQERLQDVLKTAESLRIKGLADKPFSHDEYPSQSRGQQPSSSFSSQRSSLTDSREQQPSVENEDAADSSVHSPPLTKKRKLTSSHDSSESVHDSNHDEDFCRRGADDLSIEKTSKTTTSVLEESSKASSPPSISIREKVKEEENGSEKTGASTTGSRAEYQESRAADAMLLLHGRSSEGSGEDGGATTPITPIARSTDSSTAGGHLAASHHAGRFGRPRGSSHNRRFASPINRMKEARVRFDPIYRSNCLTLRPKLRATNGSYVTIRTGTVDNFMKAIQEVREGKMGFCKAGKLYGVNPVTLQKFYKAMGYSIKNKSNNPNFVKASSTSSRVAYSNSSPQGTSLSSFGSPNYSEDYPDRPIYTHFMTPSSLDFFPRSSDSTKTSSSSTILSRNCPSNMLLDSFNVGRLLNYSSLPPYDLTEDITSKQNVDPAAFHALPLPATTFHSHTSSASNQGATSHVMDTSSSSADVSSVVLCNL